MPHLMIKLTLHLRKTTYFFLTSITTQISSPSWSQVKSLKEENILQVIQVYNKETIGCSIVDMEQGG